MQYSGQISLLHLSLHFLELHGGDLTEVEALRAHAPDLVFVMLGQVPEVDDEEHEADQERRAEVQQVLARKRHRLIVNVKLREKRENAMWRYKKEFLSNNTWEFSFNCKRHGLEEKEEKIYEKEQKEFLFKHRWK